ncbi:hypothetical protein PVL29_010013 [Vitis rotundifolia]|uniref:Uncharacterized protein n=1 Tax=Vitis rotundifolia TaxID=103349 RepID=A0AA38ZTX8_VITRO|nr:hypothetical protein PVL29_010013 [Vitis rotundifolia]
MGVSYITGLLCLISPSFKLQKFYLFTYFPMVKVPMLLPFLEEPLPATSCHPIPVFVVPVILSFLALKYVGQNTSPFKTHPKTVAFSIGCLLVFLRSSSTPNSCQCMEWFGSMFLASLASICFPDSVQWVFFVFYAILCMGGPLCAQLQML